MLFEWTVHTRLAGDERVVVEFAQLTKTIIQPFPNGNVHANWHRRSQRRRGTHTSSRERYQAPAGECISIHAHTWTHTHKHTGGVNDGQRSDFKRKRTQKCHARIVSARVMLTRPMFGRFLLIRDAKVVRNFAVCGCPSLMNKPKEKVYGVVVVAMSV